MGEALGRLKVEQLDGAERFSSGGQGLDFDLQSFWRWSASDLVSNATRGILAEYIISRALDRGVDEVRDEWGAFDILTPSGIKVEVKSAAYLQSWHQKKLSKIQFLVPKTREWDADTSSLATERKRQADVYVFALLAHKDKSTIDPLNVDQWKFYVVPTSDLNARKRSQHSITLSSLEVLAGEPIPYHELSAVVEKVGL